MVGMVGMWRWWGWWGYGDGGDSGDDNVIEHLTYLYSKYIRINILELIFT